MSAQLDQQMNDILANLTQSAANACKVVAAAVAGMPRERNCKCGAALSHAIITDRAAIPESVRRDLAPIAGRWL